MIKITSRGGDNINRKLGRFPGKFNNAKRISLFRAGNEMQEKAVQWAPYKTGNLRRSITAKFRPDKAIVGTNLVYAPPLDRGSHIKAHTQTRTKAWGRPTKPFRVRMPRRYQRAHRGVGFLTPAFLIQKKYRFREIFKQELRSVLK